jgi:hypothetical protein
MKKSISPREGKKRAGRKQGVKVRHGAYSLIVRGDLPENRRYLREHLTMCREGLISDLGPKEEDLSTAQRILIDRVIGKLGVLRCLEEFARERGVIKEGKLSSPLEHNFLGWSNSLRLDLQALGIDKRAGEKILSPLEIAAVIDAEKAEKSAADGQGSAEIARPGATSLDVSGKDDAAAPDPGQGGGGNGKDGREIAVPKQSSSEIEGE